MGYILYCWLLQCCIYGLSGMPRKFQW